MLFRSGNPFWPSLRQLNNQLATFAKETSLVDGGLRDLSTVAEFISQSQLFSKQVAPLPKGFAYLDVGSNGVNFLEDPSLRTGADLAFSAGGLFGFPLEVAAVVVKYGTEPLGEWDVEAAYNYFNAKYGLNEQGLSRVDLVIADPVAAIKARISGLFTLPAPSDSNVMYRSPPAAFAAFH